MAGPGGLGILPQTPLQGEGSRMGCCHRSSLSLQHSHGRRCVRWRERYILGDLGTLACLILQLS